MADWVVFLDEGTVTEQGIVESLLAKRGRFYDFYQEWLSRIDEPRFFGAVGCV